MLPSEALLIQVDPNFITSTIIDSVSFEVTQGFIDSPSIKTGATYILVTHNPSNTSNLAIQHTPSANQLASSMRNSLLNYSTFS